MPKGYKTCLNCSELVKGPKTRICPHCEHAFGQGYDKQTTILSELRKAIDDEDSFVRNDSELEAGIWLLFDNKKLLITKVFGRRIYYNSDGIKGEINGYKVKDHDFKIVKGTKHRRATQEELKSDRNRYRSTCTRHNLRLNGKSNGVWILSCASCKDYAAVKDDYLIDMGVSLPSEYDVDHPQSNFCIGEEYCCCPDHTKSKRRSGRYRHRTPDCPGEIHHAGYRFGLWKMRCTICDVEYNFGEETMRWLGIDIPEQYCFEGEVKRCYCEECWE